MKRETVNSFLLGVITILLLAIGFLTRNAYVEMRDEVKLMSAKVTNVSERLTGVETVLSVKKQ